MEFLSKTKLPYGLEWRGVLLGTALFTAGLATRGLLLSPAKATVLQSARTTLLPKLSKDELSELPYPPDVLPGARDVDTPYGSIRVYEFGPESGRKVLLVHGISTPCVALGSVANELADRGCRVMLFDLPGRGYSDTPADLPQDIRLFTSFILLALASSPISWTGESSGKFTLVGYSLGGGIVASFTSHLPDLVDTLVLIAPAGLIRDRHISARSRVLYSKGVIPEPILYQLVKRRLQKPLYPPKPKQPQTNETVGTSEVVQAEVGAAGDKVALLSKAHPNIKMEDTVYHQVAHHEGFVPAYMSSLRYGPVQHQHAYWRRIGARLSKLNSIDGGDKEKVLVVLGERDPVIDVKETQVDVIDVLEGNVEFKIFDAGHEVPITKGKEIAETVEAFWGEKSA